MGAGLAVEKWRRRRQRRWPPPGQPPPPSPGGAPLGGKLGANAFLASEGRGGGLLLPAGGSKLGQNAFLTPIPSRGTPLPPPWAGEPPLQIVEPNGAPGALAVALPGEGGLSGRGALPPVGAGAGAGAGAEAEAGAGAGGSGRSHSLALCAEEVEV